MEVLIRIMTRFGKNHAILSFLIRQMESCISCMQVHYCPKHSLFWIGYWEHWWHCVIGILSSQQEFSFIL